MTNILEVNGLGKVLKRRWVLEDVSFSIKRGEIFGLVGPNGAGKTTLIKIILGLYKPDTGKVVINGFDLKTDFEKAIRNASAIIESPEMYDYLTGMDNLRICQRAYNIKDDKRLKEVIEEVNLEKRINQKVRTYSLGMRQRLGIAQALVSNPKILILDEPMNGLDPKGIKQLRELLKRLAKDFGIAVLISSHILSEIELISDKVAIIDKGKLVEVKDVNSEDESKLDVFFETNNRGKMLEVLRDGGYKINGDLIVDIERDEIPLINELLVRNGILVYQIKQNNRSLEDEFLSKTRGVL